MVGACVIATRAPLDPRLVVRTYWSEANKGRGAYARAARRHNCSPEWVRQLVKRYPNTPRPVVDYVNLIPVPVRNCQPDPLLERLILTNDWTRRDITTTPRRSVELRIGIWMVLFATCITVLGTVALPVAGLVFVPSWCVLMRELSRTLEVERGSK
jgi:hypothetical protein